MDFKFLTLTDVAFIAAFILLLQRLFRKRTTCTPLEGPSPPSWIWGWTQFITASKDMAPTYESWAEKHGPAFEVRLALGQKRVVLYDPLAVAAFFSRMTVTYKLTPISKKFLVHMLGRGIIWVDGDDHKRQRKILTPAFSPQSIKSLTDVYYDSAYKTKTSWDALFDASTEQELIIDVQKWMNRISLDTIGIAGFNHDFEALRGVDSPVSEAFTSSASISGSSDGFVFVMSVMIQRFPWILNLPLLRRQNNLLKMRVTMDEIGDQLLNRHREDTGGKSGKADRSLIGTLVQAEKADPGNAMSEEEVKSQMVTLMFAGYETSSIVLTWLLLELGRHPEIQERLREELTSFGTELSFDQLWSSTAAPYLDAVVKETLRLHPPVTENVRMCDKDDVLPLLSPLTTRNGIKSNTLTITAGTIVEVPISALNTSRIIWGHDALEFKPERWLNENGGLTDMAKNMQGYHHLLTFIDGPRTCLGKAFAVTEIKAVTSVLVKNFAFSPRDGAKTKYDTKRFILARPMLEGEDPGVLPMRIQRIQ